MKKEFDLPEGEIASAYLFASAHGIYEAAVNGIRAGDGILTPGWTEYQKRILFQMYDVKDLLKDTKNTVCAHVGLAGTREIWPVGFICGAYTVI